MQHDVVHVVITSRVDSFIYIPSVKMPPLTSSSIIRSKLEANGLTRSLNLGTTAEDASKYEIRPPADHVQELHKQLCQLQLRYNRLERERNAQSDRVQELEQLLNGYEGDDPQEVLLTQSLQLAEALNTIETLKSKVVSLTQGNKTLKQKHQDEMGEDRTPPPRQGSFQMLRRQGQSFRGMLPSSSRGSENDRDPDLRRSKSLRFPNKRRSDSTSETRRLAELHRTIMEKQIEALEQERNDYLHKCQSQATTISKLRDEQKLQETKVEMLEQVVQSMTKSLPKDHHAESSIVSDHSSLPALKRSQSTKPSMLLSTSTSTSTSTAPLQSNVNRLNAYSNRRKLQVIVNGEPAWYLGTVDEADGLPHGTGTIKFSNGDKYFGEVKHGEMHGHGTLYCSVSNQMKRGRFGHDVFLGR
jgi:hypothetical protein